MVVDGSNLATEGRNTPSLAQLDEAVRAFAEERPDDEIIVVVDASFGYRIDESERKVFEEAEDAGEIVSPPAGAIGRGDGFLLRIADRIDADVLSNDSFQEFHGEYLWLFEEGRLVGGKPVPGVGWIFTPRTPVRGPKSRVATRDADRARKRVSAPAAPAAAAEPTADAIAEATAEAIAPDAPKAAKRGSRRRTRAVAEDGPPDAVNEPLPFITFIAEHPLGTEIEGTVDSFTSHGAFVTAGGARCYAPVSGLGDPPPRSAKEVLKRGEVRTFVIQALDPPRRGIELALPGLAKVAGGPTDETVEAEIDAGSHGAALADGEAAPAPKPRRRRAAPALEPAVATAAEPVSTPVSAPALAAQPARPARPRRSTVRPAAEPEVAAAPARRTRKKAVAEPVAAEPPPEPPPELPKKATRSRKKAVAVAEVVAEPAQVAAPVKKRAARKVAPQIEEPAPVVAKRARKAAPKKAVDAGPAPVKKARKSPKKAASPTE